MANRYKFKQNKHKSGYVSDNKNKPNRNNFSSENDIAHAPYNFVPLNTSIVSVGLPPSHDQYDSNRYTGYINCELTTLTPVYIRSGLTEAEVKARKAAKENSEFFSPANKIRIPGSSLRGMVRSLVEIISWSKFGFFENKNLYYRSFADVSSVRNEYLNVIYPRDRTTGKSVPNMSAGYLIKKGFDYFICPAEEKQFGRISRYEAKSQLEKLNMKYSEFQYFRLPDGRHIVVSGSMPRKKDWIVNTINRDVNKRIKILEEDIENYKFDENRGQNLPNGKVVPNLLEKCKIDNEVPCFYVTWVDENNRIRVSFGHTGMFRIAYQKSIKDHIPPNHHENIMDLANAIFGVSAENNSFAGRVFFEDALLINSDINPMMEEKTPKILMGPKPTSFQLYLEQDSTNKKRLKHYNSNTWIRGNKFYWHKSGQNWEKENSDYSVPRGKIETAIRPVKPDVKFEFKIRYENLSKVELGSLLFALKLPEECAHKIGMGKSIGLGSIRINPTMYISYRNNRYLTIFDNDHWMLADRKQDDETMREIISSFETNILGNMNDEDRDKASSLWETQRLSQLKTLLDVQKGKELESKYKIEYMELKKFKYRSVLPSPEDV